MIKTDSDIHLRAHVISESLGLPERVEIWKTNPERFLADEQLAARRLSQWCSAIGFENTSDMSLRLEAAGIDDSNMHFILGQLIPDPNPEAECPEWWSVCQSVLDTPVPESMNEADYITREGESAIPFEHALRPWVDAATRMLEAADPRLFRELDPRILRDEQRGLMQNLATCSRSLLMSDFEKSKIETYDSNDIFLGLISSNVPDTVYRRFTRDVLENSWRNYITAYPALARLLGTRVLFWVNTLHEFLERLEADREMLQSTYSPGSPLGALVKAGRGISDSHNGGRAVVVCVFENDCRIVYKPRSMSIDVAWQKTCQWLNDRGDIIDLIQDIEVIDQGSYGWMKHIDHLPCRDEAEVKLYYRRMGELLCLVHLFHGNDFHLENVVASGPNPVAIDLETVTVADVEQSAVNEGMLDSPASLVSSRSVLRTLLLPLAMSRGEGIHNLGAIGIMVDNKRGGAAQRILTGVNTDFLSWKMMSPEDAKKIPDAFDAAQRSEVLLADGGQVVPQDHLEDLCGGYRNAYQSLMDIKEEFLGPEGPIVFYEDAMTRFLNRATMVYYRLLIETTMPMHITSGMERWIAIDRLSIGFNPPDKRSMEIVNFFTDQEHGALLRGDIPYFCAMASSHDVTSVDCHDCSILPSSGMNIFTKSAIESIHSQFDGMSEVDCQRQLDFIHSSYLTTISTMRGFIHGSDEEVHYADPPARELEEGEIADFSRKILDELINEALTGEDQQMDWLDVSVDPIRDSSKIIPMDLGLYAGRGGMSLGFELGYRRFGDRRYLDAAYSSILLESKYLEFSPSGLLLSPSGLMMTPGFLLSAWRLGAHEGFGHLRSQVEEQIKQFGPRVIERDQGFDLIGGSAGMILILAKILEDGGPPCEPIIEMMGDHLLKNVTQQHGGPSWKVDASPIALCGLGHGSAGIALSLMKAWKITGREDFRTCALAAIACEHRLRNEEKMNWPDLRIATTLGEIDSVTSTHGAWCFGYPGIAAARAAVLEIEDDPIARSDFEFTMEAFRMNPFTRPMARPHLCCGSFGILEIHRTIGVRMGIQSELDLASEELNACVQIQNDRGIGIGCMGLGLFQGLMGLAWATIAVEGKVPDVGELLILS
jgi:type 2 lantibiotic biosynthesis protein LanM